ncbi:MAG: ABC transporter permease, partial [Tepidiformaceae bacterium]
MRARKAAFGFGREYLPAGVLLVALVVGWEAYVRVADVRPYLVPSPSAVWQAFVDTRGALPEHTWTTAQEALVGLALGAVAGVAIAVPV